MKVASWKRLHMFQPHLCELQVECWEGEQDSELDSWQLGSNLRSVEVIQGLRGSLVRMRQLSDTGWCFWT